MTKFRGMLRGACTERAYQTAQFLAIGTISGASKHPNNQGWVFAMAKTIFAGTVEKTGKNRGKN